MRRSGIEDHRDAAGGSRGDRVVDSPQREFKLQQDRIAGALRVKGRVDKARSQGVVGSSDQDDPVLSFGVDDDRRVAGRKRFV